MPGINANTPWYNLTMGLAMLIGRFLFLIPLLAAAGSLAAKKKVPFTSGTFPTHGPLFVGLLVGTVVIVGALTFFPALSLGPIVEHFLMHGGKLFSMVLLPLWELNHVYSDDSTTDKPERSAGRAHVAASEETGAITPAIRPRNREAGCPGIFRETESRHAC